jgi:hypothetical protein
MKLLIMQFSPTSCHYIHTLISFSLPQFLNSWSKSDVHLTTAALTLYTSVFSKRQFIIIRLQLRNSLSSLILIIKFKIRFVSPLADKGCG